MLGKAAILRVHLLGLPAVRECSSVLTSASDLARDSGRPYVRETTHHPPDDLTLSGGSGVKVSREMFRTVRWLLVGALALQLVIIPWNAPFHASGATHTKYAPIFAPPNFHIYTVQRSATVDTGRLLLQLAVTGGLLLLWLRVAKPEE